MGDRGSSGDTTPRRAGLVIVCGHVRRQRRVGGECQGVGIIADSILRA